MFQLILKSLALILAASAYCHKTLPRHDDPLATTISHAASKALADANYDDAPASPPVDFSTMLNGKNKYTPRVIPRAELLAEDQKTLRRAQSTVAWTESSAQKCRKNLKTPAAKKALAAIVDACKMDDLSRIERALNRWSQKMPKKYPEGAVNYRIHEWMEESHNEALGILADYLSSGVLFGKSYEQADAAALCAYVRNISCAYSDFHEDSLYYGWLRGIAAAYYDKKVNKNDVKACFDALKVVTGFAEKSSETADDLDSSASSAAAIEVVYDFRAGLKMVHVDRNKFGAVQVSSPRLRYFLDNAPQLFNYCQTATLPNVETTLFNQNWAYWQQANQAIWIDPKGVISVRIKTDGRITVGFLKANPYYGNGWLDQQFLGDRHTEQLKLTEAYGPDYLVAIPASAPNKPFTPLWHSGHQNPDPDQLRLMAWSHINK